MVKSALIIIIMLLTSGCAWLAQHPQVEADLEQECIDIAKDNGKVIEDAIQPKTSAVEQ